MCCSIGPPGLGKTTLAQIVARELGVGFRATSGPILQRAGDLAAILTNLQPRDVLFVDEIHRLQPAIEETLYPAMEDFRLDLIIGEGPAARTVRIDLPPFTLVGATTRAGLLTPAAARPLRHPAAAGVLRRRRNCCGIVRRGAEKLGFALAEDGAMEIARRSRGTPRVAGRLLRRVRDFAAGRGPGRRPRHGGCGAGAAGGGSRSASTRMDRRYLRRIAEHHGGGPVGVETLAAALAEVARHAGGGGRALPDPGRPGAAHPARADAGRARLAASRAWRRRRAWWRSSTCCGTRDP